MISSIFARGTLVAILAIFSASPALADSGISVYLGPQFISQGAARSVGSNVQTDIAAAIDFGPKTIVPIRASLQADDAFGSSGNGHLNTFGIGGAVRLTTPLYAGIGASIYNTNVRVDAGNASATTSGTSIGTNLFVGNKIFGLPGIGLSIEGSYKAIPTTAGVNPSAYGIGVRAQF